MLTYSNFSYIEVDPLTLPSIQSQWISESFSFYKESITIICSHPVVEIKSNVSTGYSFEDFSYKLAA